jgi:exonuclease-1
MGISGLLQALKPLIQPCNVSQLQGKRVAIDGYCWLHKAVYGCAAELCLNQETDSWIKYCLSFIDLFLHYNCKVTLVFDGAPLPAKGKTETERAEARQKNLEAAKEFQKKGDFKNARNYFARAIDITPAMAARLVAIVDSRYNQTSNVNGGSQPKKVDYIVAPFEADSQLGYLSRNDLVDVVVSEDSDCMLYGCKDIIYKLNSRDGNCERLIVNDIFTKFIDSKFDLRSFSSEMFLSMCIFSGCDYLVKSLSAFSFIICLSMLFPFFFPIFFDLVHERILYLE